MANVPVDSIPSVAPNQPMESQVIAQATPAAFGAQVGNAEQQLGENLNHISREMWASQQRIVSREDAIERVRDYGRFDQEAQKQLIKLSTEGDLSKQDTVNAYRQFVDEQKNKIVSEHRGSPDSQMRLMERLESDRIRLIGSAATMAVQAQDAMMKRNIGGTLNQLTASAYETPAAVPVLFQQLDASLKDISGALTPEQEALHRDGGRAKIAGTAIESFVARGDFESAERVLQMPGVSEVIGTEAQNRMRGVILESRLKLRDAQMKGVVEGTQIRGKLRTLLGREPSDSEVSLAAGVTPKEGAGMFGSGITGRALDIITQGAPLYAQGLMTPEQENVFQSALTQYRQPVTMLNPDNGMVETRRPELPAFVAESLRRRGIAVPASTPSNFTPPGSAPAPESQIGTRPDGVPIFPAPDEATAIRMTREASKRGQKIEFLVDPNGGGAAQSTEKIWDMASKVAGPIAAGANLLGKTPVIGDLVNFPSYTQAKNFVPILVNDLVKVLQNNPRFSEGERKQIQKEIELEPKAFDTPQSFRNRMIGVDKALAIREKNAYETARSSEVSLDERKHAMNVFAGIVKFRESLGVPPTVTSPEEAKKLGPGAVFLTPDGEVKRVPGG